MQTTSLNGNSYNNNSDWQLRMAELVGFEEEVTSSHPEASLPLVESLEESPVVDPRSLRTKQSLSANPFAKASLVGAVTFGVVMVGGVFLTQMMSGGNKQVKTPVKNIPQTQNQTLLQQPQAQAEIEVLKTKLALAEQARAVKAAQLQLKTFQPNSLTTVRDNPVTPVRQAEPKVITRVVVQRVPTPGPTVYVPRTVTVERIVIPQPVAQSNPVSKVVQPRSQPQPLPNLASISPITPTPRLAVIPNTPVNPIVNPAKEGGEIANTPNNPVIQPTANNQASNLITPPNQPTTKAVAVGTSVKAVLATAVFGESNRGSNDDKNNDNTFVVRLKQPLKTVDGSIALPAGTELLAQIRQISESGMMQLTVVSAILQQEGGSIKQLDLPQGGMKIRSSQGRPLIASKYPDRSGAIAGMDTGIFVLGGIGKAAELFNRPQTQVITNSTGNIATQTNQRTNIFTGVLEGGMNSVVPQITLRNQQAISEMIARGNIWFLKAGMEVEVYANQILQF